MLGENDSEKQILLGNLMENVEIKLLKGLEEY